MVESFRFLKHRRERLALAAADAATERDRDRAHQLQLVDQLVRMVESMSDSHTKQASETATALIEIAKSNQAQAEGFTTWLKSFAITEAPGTSVVREEDEYAAERMRLLGEFGLSDEDDLSGMPEEFRLALELRKGFIDDVRGNGN